MAGSYLDGVMVAKKDFNLPTHPTVGVRNLYVIKLCQSLKSKGYVTERFSWQYFYWFLTNEGIEYLRDYLHLPDEVVPLTLKKTKVAPRAYSRPQSEGGRGRGDRPPRGTDEKKLGPQGDFKPDFRDGGREGGREGGRGFGRGGYGTRGGRGDRPDYRRDGQGFGRGRGAAAAPAAAPAE